MWDLDRKIEDIVREWIILIFGDDKKVVENILWMFINFYVIYEKYIMLFGFGWMVNSGYYYGLNLEGYEYLKWGMYYWVDIKVIGVDRILRGIGYIL